MAVTAITNGGHVNRKIAPAPNNCFNLTLRAG